MKRSYGLLAGLTLVAMVCAQTVSAVPTTYYVSLTGTGNGSSWAAATNSLQGAVDASDSNTLSVVWVSNGWYDTGSQAGHPTSSDTVSNRLAIWKAITVRSLNGSPVTFIKGAPGIGGTNGLGATRCVFITNGASLIGFTLTNGYTGAVIGDFPATSMRGGGFFHGPAGTYGSMISNCVIVGNQSWWRGGGGAWGTVYDSTIIFNTTGEVYPGSAYGGGTYYTHHYRNDIISNECLSGVGPASPAGGGSAYGNRYNCYIAGNTVGEGTTSWNPNGGGCTGGWSWGCTIVVNRAAGTGGQTFGGGQGSTSIPGTTDFGGGRLFNCVVSGNSSDNYCGVGRNSWASNCLITANSGRDSVAGSILIDCTISHSRNRRTAPVAEGGALRCVIVSNWTRDYPSGGPGGASRCNLTNCLVIDNSSEDDAGGIWLVRALNCTITGNSSQGQDFGQYGGVRASILTNCIVWDNHSLPDLAYTNYYTCSSNAATHGVDGNITNNPLLVGGNNYRLTGNSPCIDVGTSLNWMTNVIYNLDVVRNPRVRNAGPDMGAYEAAPPEGTVVLVQ